MEVIKRNGSVVEFDREKIFKAIAGAVTDIKDYSITEENINEMVDDIYDILREEGIETIHIECLQDIVEETLMAYGYTDTARAYIKYRQLHKMARDNYKDLMDEVAIKLDASQVQNQNANVDEHSFGGRMGEVNRLVMKRFALENCMSEMAKNNHLNNMIYIHDLDSYAAGMHNCLSIPFDKLLAEGFNTRQTDVRPANSVNTAFQLVAVIFQLQSLQQFGGVSATHLDWTMVPYVRKSFWKHYKDGLVYIELNSDYQSRAAKEDIHYIIKGDWSDLPINDRKYIDDIYDAAYTYAIDMTKKEIHQAVEGMYHNLNTLQSRSGNQLPFTSINYGTCTLPEGRLVTQALLEVSLEGIGKLKKTPIFPCGIFQCMKGVNQEEGDPNYDLFKLAIKSTAKRLYPNYANVDWSGNAGYDRNDPRTYFSTMGKRKLQLM